MNSVLLGLLCAFFCSMNLVLGDAEISGDGATADVQGQSGKITMYYQDQSTQITMSSVTEVDSNGNAVGTSGSSSGKHSFNSFASQDFTFSDVEETDFQGVASSALNFTCPLVDGEANLRVELYLFLEQGNVKLDNKNYTATPGSFKFSYNLDNWPFCTIGGTGATLCEQGNQEQEGAFLDFAIILKGKGDNAQATTDNTDSTITYEDNSEVTLPNRYQVDGEWFTMPNGYPLTSLQGSQQVVTFRFARFSGALDYDPFVNWGAGSNGSARQFGSLVGGVVAAIMMSAFLVM